MKRRKTQEQVDLQWEEYLCEESREYSKALLEYKREKGLIIPLDDPDYPGMDLDEVKRGL